MGSMNLIFSSGALIFLLLVVGSAYGAGVSHEDACSTATSTAVTPPKPCDETKGLKCYKPGTTEDINTNVDLPGALVTDTEADGRCFCDQTAGPKGWTPSDTCGPPVPRHRPDHGENCGNDVCLDAFKCHFNGKGYKDGKTEDDQGIEWVKVTHDGKPGRCVCTGEKKVYNTEEKMCEKAGTMKPDPGTADPGAGPDPGTGTGTGTTTHNEEHAADCDGVKDCKPIFECSVGGTIKTDGTTADTFGVKWDATKHTGMKGSCACKDKKVFKVDKCEEGTTSPGTTMNPETAPNTGTGTDKTKPGSGSNRIVYPTTSVQLTIAAIGSLLVLGIS